VAERLLHTQSAEGRSRGGCGRVSGAGAPGTRNAGRTQRHAAAAIPAASAEGAAHAQPRAALGTLLWRPALLRGAVECRVAGPCRMLRGSALPEWRRCGLAPRGKAARHALAECCGSRAHPVAAAARAARQRPCATPPPQGKACNSVRHDTKPRCEPPRTCYDCRYWRRSSRHAQRAAGGGGEASTRVAAAVADRRAGVPPRRAAVSRIVRSARLRDDLCGSVRGTGGRMRALL
jgi:hypothetical protein